MNCVELIKKESCANCGACLNICPRNSIFVDPEPLFYTISVNADTCIDCGLCTSVCPVINEEKKQNVIKAYGFISKDKNVVKKSSSGGAFTEIARYVLDQGGIIWGAVFDKDYKSVVFGSTDDHDLDDIRRSKYVESSVGLSFSKIKEQLTQNKLILFCGTPCEAAGLKNFLGKEYENLIICDFSCGGLPSHKIYQKYLSELEKKRGKVKDVNFRPKLFGWTIHSIRIRFDKKRDYKRTARFDPFFYPFLYGGMSKRRNCLDCRFSNNHYSDIILADFWLYRKIGGYGLNESGISLVITNSIKGEKVIQAIKNNAEIKELPTDAASYNLKNSSVSDYDIKEREKYLSNISKYGVYEAAAKAGMPKNHRINELKSKIVIVRRKVYQFFKIK